LRRRSASRLAAEGEEDMGGWRPAGVRSAR
jgi:hypothetical protein